MTAMLPSRRTFLQQLSSAAALGSLARFPSAALGGFKAADLFPVPDAALLSELALKAIDAARTAGATFADVRIGTVQSLAVSSSYLRGQNENRPFMSPPGLGWYTGYGIRAIVDGAWGFTGGYDFTADGVAAVAREAVAVARGNRPRHARTLALAPAPRVDNGRWATPIERDPFEIPIGEIGDLELASIGRGMEVESMSDIHCGISWTREESAFASTEGSLLRQRIDQCVPGGFAAAMTTTRVGIPYAVMRRGGYGYEGMGPEALGASVRAAADEALIESRKPRKEYKPVEVGRYDLVFSADVVAQMLVMTVAEALNLERALGYRANREGTSFAAPPLDMLGTYQIGSKLLSVRADRSKPHALATIGWDGEGVKPEDYTLVRDGVIVDYLTGRETAVALAPWYQGRGEPLRSHGCAGGARQGRPHVEVPNLTVAPAAEAVTVDDMIADTKRGFFVDMGYGATDQQVLNTQYGGGRVREIRDGKLGGWIGDMAYQFITPQFWKSMDALGGAATAKSIQPIVTRPDDGHDPFQTTNASIEAVPARFRQVNVLNTGRTA